MAEWDLTSKLSPFLDRHFLLIMLGQPPFTQRDIYDENDVLRVQQDVLSKTNMVDYEIELFKQQYPEQEIPEAFSIRRENIIEKYNTHKNRLTVILELFENEEALVEIKKCEGDNKRVIEYLANNHNFDIAMVDMCYDYAKFMYDVGSYKEAAQILYFHRTSLIQPTDKNYLNTMWGALAVEIVERNWDSALTELKCLEQFIEESTFQSSLNLLQQRTWLIHWALFVFFFQDNPEKGRESLIQMFLYQKQYLNVIQTTCPWILRYLSTAVITQNSDQKRRNVMKDLVKVIQEESYTYRDPITSFIEDLYVNFDFKGAQQKLRECRDVLFNDFFLVACLDDFIENSRLMIFETFCRIHQCISISMLAEKLNMGTEEAERWIVNLIRNAKLDAKIDSQLGHVVMGTQTTSPYEQLIERTKALSFRSQMLQLNVEKKKKAQDQPNWGTDGF